MYSRIKHLVRAVLCSIALLGLSGGIAWAGPTECEETATGGQTGQGYTRVSQSLVTETTTVTLSAGGECLLGTSGTTTIEEQYYVGYYRNDVTGDIARVDCRTYKVTAWV